MQVGAGSFGLSFTEFSILWSGMQRLGFLPFRRKAQPDSRIHDPSISLELPTLARPLSFLCENFQDSYAKHGSHVTSKSFAPGGCCPCLVGEGGRRGTVCGCGVRSSTRPSELGRHVGSATDSHPSEGLGSHCHVELRMMEVIST